MRSVQYESRYRFALLLLPIFLSLSPEPLLCVTLPSELPPCDDMVGMWLNGVACPRSDPLEGVGPSVGPLRLLLLLLLFSEIRHRMKRSSCATRDRKSVSDLGILSPDPRYRPRGRRGRSTGEHTTPRHWQLEHGLNLSHLILRWRHISQLSRTMTLDVLWGLTIRRPGSVPFWSMLAAPSTPSIWSCKFPSFGDNHERG
ncbi:hypothetical protein VTN77DRAFT_543 [Rasamsonia byssochlamydoides]|uniref:uncharacterized protein n=1 Tax=Rasamsonia byssochlamydoides TaxID=89139 RepID=UPI003744712E